MSDESESAMKSNKNLSRLGEGSQPHERIWFQYILVPLTVHLYGIQGMYFNSLIVRQF